MLTVSPTYAREICEDPAMACGMQRVLRARGVRYATRLCRVRPLYATDPYRAPFFLHALFIVLHVLSSASAGPG